MQYGLSSPRFWQYFVLFFFLPALAAGQQSPALNPQSPDSGQQPATQTSAPVGSTTQAQAHHKKDYGKTHLFWIVPNYRADDDAAEMKPLTSHQKLKMTVSDSFDPSAFAVAGIFAGISMAQRQYPHFGQGAQGFGKYYGGAFADQAVGNFMSEAFFPIAFRQDPRYFEKGKGGFWRRTSYAVSREWMTRGDNGHSQFNVSELAGNFVAAGISNAYYPAADRSFGNTVNKWGQQIALDAFLNVMKEFWPDMRQKLFHSKDQ